MTCVMVRDMRGMQTPILTRAATRKVKLMDRESTLGPTGKFMTASGILTQSTVMEFGLVLKMILTSVSGTSLKLTVMVFMFGPTAIDMKASGT